MSEPTDEELLQLARKVQLYQANALLFRRAGGVVTLEEFEKLPPEKQVALARAGDQHAFVLAVLTGFASQGHEQALAVLALVDGGKAKREHDLERTVRDMLGGMGTKVGGA